MNQTQKDIIAYHQDRNNWKPPSYQETANHVKNKKGKNCSKTYVQTTLEKFNTQNQIFGLKTISRIKAKSSK